jgi:hypothetical protein
VVSCLTYSLALKTEETCSSETSVGLQRTIRRYIPEDTTLHNRSCGNPKSYKDKEVHTFCMLQYTCEYSKLWSIKLRVHETFDFSHKPYSMQLMQQRSDLFQQQLGAVDM